MDTHQTYDNPWLLQTGEPLEVIPEGAVGFIYQIENTSNGKFYIGKKLFKFKKTKVLKGKKKRSEVESDWKTYYGSNKTLVEDIKNLGSTSTIKRRILKLCYSKTECNYEETRYIMEHRALFKDNYYNDWVTFKVTRKHVESALKKNLF
jgi:hypothetical protein